VLIAAFCRTGDSLHAGVRVYRCTNGAGEIELRQTYCPSGEQEQLQVETPNTGWVRPKRPDNGRRKGKKSGASRSRKTESGASGDTPDQARRLSCWKAEKKLERVQRQLRQGYRAARGEKLRQQRREQEQFLRSFCRP
jgi:hypothetical protein